MSTTLRKGLLKTLQLVGVKSFRARSGLGYPFFCFVGDFAGEVPFYNRKHSQTEILVMAKWCADHPHALMFDVGANLGFVCTHVALAAKASNCRIIAFEAVYPTFAKLTKSIHALGLESQILPVCCTVSDHGGTICSIAFNEKESLFAQVRRDVLNCRSGQSLTWSSTVTLDSVVESIERKPRLVKIDVEGHEAHVLRGARALLRSPDAPLICFELNPMTLSEVGSNVGAVASELQGYRFFYLDDFEGQRLPLGREIKHLSSLTWTCNLLATPPFIPEAQIVAFFDGCTVNL